MNKKQPPLPAAFPADAETINAVVDSLGALVICLCRTMTTEQKDQLASDLARLAAQSTATGKTVAGRLIADLSRAAAI